MNFDRHTIPCLVTVDHPDTSVYLGDNIALPTGNSGIIVDLYSQTDSLGNREAFVGVLELDHVSTWRASTLKLKYLGDRILEKDSLRLVNIYSDLEIQPGYVQGGKTIFGVIPPMHVKHERAETITTTGRVVFRDGSTCSPDEIRCKFKGEIPTIQTYPELDEVLEEKERFEKKLKALDEAIRGLTEIGADVIAGVYPPTALCSKDLKSDALVAYLEPPELRKEHAGVDFWLAEIRKDVLVD